MSSSKSILLVDDEMLIAMDMQDTLSEQGHFVTVASTVAQAEQALKAGGLDLAILDYHLKDGSTEPLMQHLQEIGVPFIICRHHGKDRPVCQCTALAQAVSGGKPAQGRVGFAGGEGSGP